jgi:DNA transformation protein
MAGNLSAHINIGSDTETKLAQVGIDTLEKLIAEGSEKAFLKIRTIDPGACLNLLYGLEGAIRDVKWHDLPADRKQELKQFFNLASR